MAIKKDFEKEKIKLNLTSILLLNAMWLSLFAKRIQNEGMSAKILLLFLPFLCRKNKRI